MQQELTAHTPRRLRISLAILIVTSLLMPLSAAAQLTASAGQQTAAPRVFLECSGFFDCNLQFYRTEIQWVNWIREPADADVHIIITSEDTAGGGDRYTLDFIGQGAMSELSDTLTYTSSGQDVEEETLNGLTQTLELGMLRFAVEAGMGGQFDLAFNGEIQQQSGDGAGEDPENFFAVEDPWDYWSFNVSVSGDLDLRETRTDERLDTRFSADRITDDWKLELDLYNRFSNEEFELPDGATITDNRDQWSMDFLLVRSISNHFSVGGYLDSFGSEQNNRKTRMTLTPAIEWNYFPYAEANRRQMIAHYAAGMQYNEYFEETVLGELEETIPLHKLGVQYRAIESWGNASVSFDASQYLHQSGLYRLTLSGNLSFRITRGLDLSLSASAQQVEDEIHFPLNNVAEEDILLGRQSLPSSYRYEASVGLSYRFGSELVNIVNTRFPFSVR